MGVFYLLKRELLKFGSRTLANRKATEKVGCVICAGRTDSREAAESEADRQWPVAMFRSQTWDWNSGTPTSPKSVTPPSIFPTLRTKKEGFLRPKTGFLRQDLGNF